MSISKDTALSILAAYEKIELIEKAIRITEGGVRVPGIVLYDGKSDLHIEVSNAIAIEALNHALVAARAELDAANQRALEELK
ncbi:hypothetical protein FACS1894110_18360 [Spirochaetia bacterium]|nr:hypothetical protein FACS1894110_18360 [Spirochaetia bacterium]